MKQRTEKTPEERKAHANRLLSQLDAAVNEYDERVAAAKKPIDPSPTPWDHSTWGFYCDTCDVFFDLLNDGRVLLDESRTHDYEHKVCGKPARYIGYDHNAPQTAPCGQKERDQLMLSMLEPEIVYYGPHPCESCGKTICKVSREQGGIAFDYPAEPIYPNTNWAQHVCGVAPKGEERKP